MNKENFSSSFSTPKPSHEVFELLLDVRKWWFGLFEESITGKSAKPGDEFNFKAGGGLHNTTQKMIELVPGKKIAWLVTESDLGFLKNPGEWKGTKISFELSAKGKNTQVTFTHEGLYPQIECYSNCSSAWMGYLNNLKNSLN